jgi:hypothetical protein
MKEMNYKIETYEENSYCSRDTVDITINSKCVRIGGRDYSKTDIRQIVAILDSIRFEED